MIEHHQGYTARKRLGRNSFRTIGKHPYKMIHNARADKYDLIQQFEASTSINLPSGVKRQLMHSSKPSFGQATGYHEITDKGN